MLRRTLAGEDSRRVKFGADSRIDALDFDGLHVGGFALRLRTGNFFDLAVEPFIGNQFEVGHLCGEPNAVLTAPFNVDQELVLAGSCGVPRDGEGVFSGIEMKTHEVTGLDVDQWLWAVEEPPGERLLARWKEACGGALD